MGDESKVDSREEYRPANGTCPNTNKQSLALKMGVSDFNLTWNWYKEYRFRFIFD